MTHRQTKKKITAAKRAEVEYNLQHGQIRGIHTPQLLEDFERLTTISMSYEKP